MGHRNVDLFITCRARKLALDILGGERFMSKSYEYMTAASPLLPVRFGILEREAACALVCACSFRDVAGSLPEHDQEQSATGQNEM